MNENDQNDTQEEEEQETADTSEQANTEKAQDKKLKVTFTPEQQAHVNSLIAAERKATERKFTSQIAGVQSALEERQGDIQFYEAQMETIIAAQTSDWDVAMKELFNALPVKERLEKLADETFMSKVRRKNVIPKTPKSDETEQPKKMVGFGRR